MEPAVEDAVMFRLIDALGLAVFRMIQVQPFTPGEVAVVLDQIAVFLPLDVLLATLQTESLPGAEPAGGDAVVDASLLMVHAAVHLTDPWVEGVEEIESAGAAGQCGGADQGGKCGHGEERFHDVRGGVGFQCFALLRNRASLAETRLPKHRFKRSRRVMQNQHCGGHCLGDAPRRIGRRPS